MHTILSIYKNVCIRIPYHYILYFISYTIVIKLIEILKEKRCLYPSDWGHSTV